tara:strand:- start:2203 stop:3258 length:1056 start_codon:yes stop_codon:yes gene_type:complete
MSKTKNLIPAGTLRIKAKNLGIYIRKNNMWKKSKKKFSESIYAIELFKAHNNFDVLIDKKNPKFLKGQLSKEGKTQGARINVLPDDRKLSGAYSLFAKNLTIHDETSNNHWDVLYENFGGTFTYLYTLGKIKKSVKKKYKLVEEFGSNYSKIKRNVLAGLKNKKDKMAVAMYTLLTTYMRVGNEIYYKAHKHKGLTTLKKKDIKIKGNKVTFKYLSKGGVPRKITEEFPKTYITRLKGILKKLKKNDFVFATETRHPLKDKEFEKAFKKYCGTSFYPHIVRSYYATEKAKKFLKNHKTASKKEIGSFYLGIAEKLGHKKFVKKKHTWEDSSNVTIHHYIQPELVEKINNLT